MTSNILRNKKLTHRFNNIAHRCSQYPSGNLNPSEADISVTKKLKEGGNIMDIQLLDHIILTEESFYSMHDNGII